MRKNSQILLALTLVIVLFSLLLLYSSCHQKGEFVKRDIFNRQLVWIGIGFFVLLVFSIMDYRHLKDIAWPFYGFAVFSLVAVLFIGDIRSGAQRWLQFGFINFQPSEIGKIALIIVLSQYFSQKSFEELIAFQKRVSLVRGFLLPLAITGLPALLVMVQPDLGTALVYLFLFFSLVLFCGVRMRYLVVFISMAVSASPLLWFLLHDYQKDRLLVFLNPNRDPLGAGYTIIQSRIAIGSGGVFGKGWLAGTQNQLNFLSERHTDFIFSTLGEEWGFLGGVALLVVFYLLIRTICAISFASPDPFAKNLCICIAFLICIQCFVNIAMTIGLMPVVGLPLPLMSYGGSSLVSFLMLIGIVVNISRNY